MDGREEERVATSDDDDKTTTARDDDKTTDDDGVRSEATNEMTDRQKKMIELFGRLEVPTLAQLIKEKEGR
jgi:hypothetical protein